MTPAQIFMILLARRWLLGLTVGVVLATSVGLSLLRAPSYSATTQVLVDLGSTNPVAGVALPASLTQAYLTTQVEILTSQKVALRVVDELHRVDSDEAIARWQKETHGRGSIRHWAADALLRRLDVRPAKDSSVISITFSDSSAADAASIANAFAQAYIDTQIDIRTEPAKRSRDWFSQQAQRLREQLDVAQRRVTEYQRAKGIFSSEERFDVENARLLELSTQFTSLSAQAAEMSKRKQLANESSSRGGASDLPEVLQNPLVQQLKGNAARLEARLKELSAVFGRNHPEMLRVQQELDATRARLVAEVDTVAASVSKSYALAERREFEARAALDGQRARVMSVKQSRDELRVLERDLENAQRAYDQGLQRLNQAALESRSTQGNVLTLNPAVEPSKPSSPNLPLNAMAGMVLGCALGVFGVLVIELRDRRVRSPADLVAALSVPVLGQIRRVSTRPLRLGYSPSSSV